MHSLPILDRGASRKNRAITMNSLFVNSLTSNGQWHQEPPKNKICQSRLDAVSCTRPSVA